LNTYVTDAYAQHCMTCKVIAVTAASDSFTFTLSTRMAKRKKVDSNAARKEQAAVMMSTKLELSAANKTAATAGPTKNTTPATEAPEMISEITDMGFLPTVSMR